MTADHHCELTSRLDKLEIKVDRIIELISPLKVKVYATAAVVSVITAFIIAHIASK